MSVDLELKRKNKTITPSDITGFIAKIKANNPDISFKKMDRKGESYDCLFWGYSKCDLILDEEGKVILSTNSALSEYMDYLAAGLSDYFKAEIFDPQIGEAIDVKKITINIKKLKALHDKAIKKSGLDKMRKFEAKPIDLKIAGLLRKEKYRTFKELCRKTVKSNLKELQIITEDYTIKYGFQLFEKTDEKIKRIRFDYYVKDNLKTGNLDITFDEAFIDNIKQIISELSKKYKWLKFGKIKNA